MREQLRIALSGAEAKEGESAIDIVGRIKALRSQNSVEPAPERGARTIAPEEPVTARIRRRAEARVTEECESLAKVNHSDEWQCRLAKEAKVNTERMRESR